MEIKKEEIEWIRKNYPNLFIQEGSPTKLLGMLKFRAICGEELPEIQDEYQIEIEFGEISLLPQVRETGNRISTIAEKKNISLMDLHVNKENGNLCLCTPLEEESLFSNGFDLKKFFSNLLIPFFYSQSYFERTGVWPWEDYNHGHLGLLESYASLRQTDSTMTNKCIGLLKQQKWWNQCKELLSRKGFIKGHWLCLCDSSLIFRKCRHQKALEGLKRLKEDIEKYSIGILD